MKLLIVSAAVLSCVLLSCNYFDSAFSPVESTPTTLNGRVVDYESKNGIPLAEITLSGLRDTVVFSDENGLFQFPVTTTGEKTITVLVENYHVYRDTLDLTVNPNKIDSIFMIRLNRQPRIDSIRYPRGRTGLPLNIRFTWTVSDSDFGLAVSREALRYYFYFDNTEIPGIMDSGIISINGRAGDSALVDSLVNAYTLSKPDSFPLLQADTVYYWKIVVKDLLGDSAVAGMDSFRTRPAFDSACPPEMAFVEMETLSFCMDTVEMTNEMYHLFDTNYYPTYPTDIFSDTSITPVIDRQYDSAKFACQFFGKRLCKISEWKAAMGGYERRLYPYGNVYDPEKCHTNIATDSVFEGYTVPVGSMDSCVSTYGIYDLSGNVSEWVDCTGESPCYDGNDGAPLNHYAGGFWSSKENSSLLSVHFTKADHRPDIGFRCCKDIQ